MSEEELRAILGSLTKSLSELAKAQQKTEAAQQKTEAAQQKTEAAQQKTETAIRELHKELGGVGRTQGEIAEDLFRRNIKRILKNRGFILDELAYNWKMPDAEYDLIGINGIYIILIEVKSRLQEQDIDTLIFKQIPSFRKYFDQYKGHKLIGSLASLAVSRELEKQVEKAGLFLFTQTEEGGASLVNSPDFKPRFY